MSELTETRKARLLAYCKLTELQDDPEVQTLIPVLYANAVGYLESAGISSPPEGSTRSAQWELCLWYLVLDAWERRDRTITGTIVAANPAFRNLINQLKLTEPIVSNSDTIG